MALQFTRLRGELSYFENSDFFTVESLLDLMSDLYYDVQDGMSTVPSNCVCEDADALLTNLIWLGTLFRQILIRHSADLSKMNAPAREQLDRLSVSLERDISGLQADLQKTEQSQARAAELQREKQRLMGLISRQQQQAPDLIKLQQNIDMLKKDHAAAESKWTQVREEQSSLNEKIQTSKQAAAELETRIREEIQPQLTERNAEKTCLEKKLETLNADIAKSDNAICKLKEQISNLRRDLEQNDTQRILDDLNEQKGILEQEKQAVTTAMERAESILLQIQDVRNQKTNALGLLEKRRADECLVRQELSQYENELSELSRNEAQFLQQKRRCSMLKAAAEQLRKDSAHLCKRTGMSSFTLDQELAHTMDVITGYLNSVAGAINKYNQQMEEQL